MAAPQQSLPPAKLKLAMERVRLWRSAPSGPVTCPACTAPDLAIIDRSTRPYAEWYVLSCPSCGLAHTLHIPLSPMMPDSE